MQVIISTRGCTITTTYKDAMSAKLRKLERLYPKLIEAKIVLTKEKHRRTAALTLIGKNHTFRSVETAEDMTQAVDLAVGALGRQVRQLKDRVRHRKTRRAAAAALPVEALPPVPPPDAEGPAADVVVRRVAPKPMSLEEAVEQFHLDNDDHHHFMVFTNARTDALNVLYRRKDGGLGLIEPVA
jgi:putative sigma-54 modulation protein